MALITTSSPYLTPLDFNNLGSDEQVWISALVDACSDFLEKKLNRKFTKSDLTEIQNGDGDNVILVKRPPINSLTSIIIKGTTDRTISSTNFTFEADAGIIQWKTFGITDVSNFLGSFPRGHQNIHILYNGGFQSIPSTVQLVIAEMVIESFDRTLVPGSAQKERLGQYFIDYGIRHAEQILMNRKQILSMYRRHVV